MLLEPYYQQLSAQVSAWRAQRGLPKVERESLDRHVATMFAHVVALEDVIAQDDPRKIELALADVAIDALAALHDLGEPWCLRTPRHTPGRYQAAAELTSDRRHRTQVVLQYWAGGYLRDTGVALELVLKGALELASRLDLDLAMPLVGRLRSSSI